MLAVIETHPIQYHAPVYRILQRDFKVPVTVIYGSDFSVAGYLDKEFESRFSWDTDLLTGYQSIFLSRVSGNGTTCAGKVSCRGLGKTLARVAPAAVLITGYSPFFHQAAIGQSLKTRCPILFRGETTDHGPRRNSLKTFARDLLLRWFYNRCAKILYVGHLSLRHFERLGVPDGKLVFSPYGVDAGAFQTDERARDRLRQATRRTLEIEDSRAVVLFSGKLTARKDPGLILQAIKQMENELRGKITVLFLGSGPEEKSLRPMADAVPAVDARFLGFKNQTELSSYYHAADFLVLPSRMETWGLVVNEALGHGLPCVVSDQVGCAPDLIEEGSTGEIFTSGSSLGLKSAMERMLSRAGQKDLRDRCRGRVKNYSLEDAARGIAAAYAAVVK